MICLRCGHYIVADREMAREQRSDACRCDCHKPGFALAPNAYHARPFPDVCRLCGVRHRGGVQCDGEP